MTEQEQTPDQLWNQVQQDRSTPAEKITEVETKVETTETTTQEVKEEGKADDPLAGLPEATRKYIEDLRTEAADYKARLKETNQKLASQHGIAGNLKQQLEKTQAKLNEILPTIESIEAEKKRKAQEEAEAKAAKRKELRDGLAETLPEVLEYIDINVDGGKPADEKPAPAKAELAKPAKAEVGKPETQAAEPNAKSREDVQRLMLALHDKVPGWTRIRETQEFKAWSQGPGKQTYEANMGSWDVDEVAGVFTAFDKHQKDAAKVAQVEKERQERLRRSEGIVGRGTTSMVVDGSDDALWNKVKRDREKAAQAA